MERDGESGPEEAWAGQDLWSGSEGAAGTGMGDFRLSMRAAVGADSAGAGGPVAKAGRDAVQRRGGRVAQADVGQDGGPVAGARASGAATEAAAACAGASVAVPAGAGEAAQRMGPGRGGESANGLC